MILQTFNIGNYMKECFDNLLKRLGLNYRKPFIIYNESPEDADDLLLKKRQ